ncbi:MAG: hypothetical protein RQ729_04560 [Wenzhouxiangellaceae bacterium]|nr:hypothetical protein [Wenzhouxiangellaceae bacterium]
MKKFAIGCFGVLLVLSVVGGGVAWFKFIKPGLDWAGGLVEMGQQLEQLDQQVVNRSSFDPPADRVLVEAQFERFRNAQRYIVNHLEGQLGALRKRVEEIDQRLDRDGADIRAIGDAVGTWSEITGLLVEAKRAQVEALNAEGFSAEEYRWVREQVYRALGENVAVASLSANPQFANQSNYQPTIPEATRTLVEPHAEELMKAYALAWWGL